MRAAQPSVASRIAERAFAPALLGPVTLLYLAFLIAPIGYFLAVSLLKYSASAMYLPSVTLENYRRLLFDGYYRQIIYNTLRMAAVVTVLSLVGGYALAYFLFRMKSRWRSILMFLVIAPLMTGVIVRTYGWIVLLGSDGLINWLLQLIGLTSGPVQMLDTEGAVIVALVHIMLPYMVFPIFSSLVSQDPHLAQAAGTLGAGSTRSFFEVTLPLSRSGMVMGSALVFTLTAGSIVTPSLLGGKNVTMIGPLIYQLILSTFNWPLGAAVAALLVLCQLLLILFYFRKTRRGY